MVGAILLIIIVLNYLICTILVRGPRPVFATPRRTALILVARNLWLDNCMHYIIYFIVINIGTEKV